MPAESILRRSIASCWQRECCLKSVVIRLRDNCVNDGGDCVDNMSKIIQQMQVLDGYELNLFPGVNIE